MRGIGIQGLANQFFGASCPGGPPIYGVMWDKGATPTLTRTDAAVGMVANVGVDAETVVNDFDGAEIFGEIAQVADGLGNVFMRIPKFYIRKTDDVGYKTWQVSKTRWSSDCYLPWCFWDFTNSAELPYVDVGKYEAGKSGLVLESKSGLYPLVFTTIENMRSYAEANGVGYQQFDIHIADVLQTLFYIEFATLNSQSIMYGYSNGNYSSLHKAVVAEIAANRIIVANAYADLYEVGQAIAIGTTLGGNQVASDRTITGISVYDASNKAIGFDGAAVNIAVGNIVYNAGYKCGGCDAVAATSGSKISNSTGKHSMKYRGIENLYGSVWAFVDGVNCNALRTWVCQDANDYVSGVCAAPYLLLSYWNVNANAFVSAMGWDSTKPYAAFPVSVADGANNKYYCDMHYYGSTAYTVACLGGHRAGTLNNGMSLWLLSYNAASAFASVGGRLMKKAL